MFNEHSRMLTEENSYDQIMGVVSHRGLIKLWWIIYIILIKVSYMISGIIICINWIINKLYL
jgi:hypothetical protein